MNEVARNSDEKRVARPLAALVPLIKKDIEAAQEAGMEYYRAAGEKLIEAKAQMKHGEFGPWIKRHFDISQSQTNYYMRLAHEKFAAVEFTSIKDFRRRGLGQDIPTTGGGVRQPTWQEPVKKIINKVDVETLNLRKAELARRDEREAERKLAMQLIDIGFKTLATKLHPDKGGSRDAMARLNRVRDRLRSHA